MTIVVYLAFLIPLLVVGRKVEDPSRGDSPANESTANVTAVKRSSGIKYADDCTLPTNWRSKGLTISPNQYLSYLERKVKSGYNVKVSCSDGQKTFVNDIRDSLSTSATDTIDSFGYINVYCDTKVFAPDIFKDSKTGIEHSPFCKTGCTDLPLDLTLYSKTYPTGAQSGDTPVQYVADTSGDKVTAAATKITCLEKFTRPVNDDGASELACQSSGGFSPTYKDVHSCKPGCDDRTINRLPGMLITGKAVSTRSGDPPFAFVTDETDEAQLVTFSCAANWQLYYDEEKSDGQAFFCKKAKDATETSGWSPTKTAYCRFNPSTGYPLLPSLSALLITALLVLVVLLD